MAAAVSTAAEPIDYVTQIKPILHERCYACHGALKQESSLRLDTAALAVKGGEAGPAIVPGDVAASPLVARVSATEEVERMPPEGEPLKPAQVAALRTWIEQGAKAPADEQPERDPRDHWAFKPPVRPAVPQVAEARFQTNPIDAFLESERARRGIVAQPAADKRIWLRRVSLDLIGLPPTLQQQDDFLKDESPLAYEKVVNRLLDSPHYGERWGRHWMDVWRYSDWWGLGAEVRNSQKHIWHWRDWIIESLNADRGYDQMLREMLAADELYPNDLDRLRATGFLARQYFKFNRTSWLDETIEHTSKAMLGLTFNCTKCHDHKYDPVTQEEYYRFRAVFEPYQVRTDVVPGEIDLEKDGVPRAFDCNLSAETFVHVRGDDRNPDKSRALTPGFPAILSFADFPMEPVVLPTEAVNPGLRSFVVAAHLKAAEQRVGAARGALADARKKLSKLERQLQQAAAAAQLTAANAGATAAADPAKANEQTTQVDVTRRELAVAEKAVAAAEAQLPSIQARAAADRASHARPAPADRAQLIAAAARAEKVVALAVAEENVARAELEAHRADGDAGKRKEAGKKLADAQGALESARKALDAPGDKYTPLAGSLKTLESNLETEDSRGKPFPTTSTGRRSALARWITDPRHPLPARVAVNHIWARHLGRPLVPTVFDFGRKGAPPTHPELLDWLAVELVDHGWSMKHIHRLIVTSLAYRAASTSAGAKPETLAADRENRYYWRANPGRIEAQLVRDSLLHLADELDLTIGGPSIPVADETSRRRSLYFVHSHNEHQKFLSMFDDASVLDCYRRAESIVPQQALALENSPLAAQMAEKIAARIDSAGVELSDEDFVRRAFVAVLACEPSAAEKIAALETMQRWRQLVPADADAAARAKPRTHLIRALLNHNDFVTIR